MPRRNRRPYSAKHPSAASSETSKTRYLSKAAAERQIREIQKYNPDLALTVYQSPADSKWYLTSN